MVLLKLKLGRPVVDRRGKHLSVFALLAANLTTPAGGAFNTSVVDLSFTDKQAQAFLDELVAQGVKAEAAAFAEVAGWLPGAPRHDLVSTSSASTTEAQAVSVGLLQLLPEDLIES